MAGGGKVYTPKPKMKQPAETMKPTAKFTSGRKGKPGMTKARVVGGKYA